MLRSRLSQAVAAVALLAAGIGVGAAASGSAASDDRDRDGSTVVNKNGHTVDEHAAHGQETAARARAGQQGHGRPAGVGEPDCAREHERDKADKKAEKDEKADED